MRNLLILLFLIGLVSALVFLRPTVFNELNSKNRVVKTRFAVVTDTHSDSENTRKALLQAKDGGVEFIVSIGDLTKVGSREELAEAKADFESVGLEYYVVPGDHDLYAAEGTAFFEEYFSTPYRSFAKGNVRFVMMDTSSTKLGINGTQMQWLESTLKADPKRATFVFMHLPVYHPNSPRTVWEKAGNNQEVKEQSEKVLKIFGESNILATFSGDHHFSSDYTEPTTGVKMYIVGAVTRERNLQRPRFDIVTLYTDDSYEVEEIIIK